MKSGRLLDTPKRRASTHRFYSSYASSRHHCHHHQNHYKRSERYYSPEGFKKAKHATFDGGLTMLEDAEAWLFGMNKLFRLHDYPENMKSKIATFSIKEMKIYGGKMLSMSEVSEKRIWLRKSLKDSSGRSTYMSILWWKGQGKIWDQGWFHDRWIIYNQISRVVEICALSQGWESNDPKVHQQISIIIQKMDWVWWVVVFRGVHKEVESLLWVVKVQVWVQAW